MTEAMKERPWWLVVDPLTGRYSNGFDRDAELDFKRVGEDRVSRFRMSSQHPAFNIAGLLWRMPADSEGE